MPVDEAVESHLTKARTPNRILWAGCPHPAGFSVRSLVVAGCPHPAHIVCNAAVTPSRMTPAPIECLLFDMAALLPDAWRASAGSAPVRAFNPALLRDQAGWIMAYRVVLADGRRRLALCRLDAALRVVTGSPLPLSDHVKFPPTAPYPKIARQWLADPRLYRWAGRLFIYWNSGWHEPHNHQFLQELDPGSFAPLGPPRELQLRGARRPLEKNWTFFAAPGGALRAIYSIMPHRVLGFSLAGDGDIVFDEVETVDWAPSSYPASHGGLRGGAPPVWHEDHFWSFGHSVHDGPAGYCYAAGVYAFSAGPGFAPVAEPVQPLDLGRPHSWHRAYPRLNPAVDEVIYPCGAAHDGTRWLISHGINDEQCAISRVDHATVRSCVRPYDQHAR